jgi:hypothetical protein
MFLDILQEINEKGVVKYNFLNKTFICYSPEKFFEKVRPEINELENKFSEEIKINLLNNLNNENISLIRKEFPNFKGCFYKQENYSSRLAQGYFVVEFDYIAFYTENGNVNIMVTHKIKFKNLETNRIVTPKGYLYIYEEK